MHIIASFYQENTKAEKNSLEIITRPKRKYTVYRNQKLVEMDKLWYFKFHSWLWGQNHLKIQGWILHFFCFIFFFKTSPPAYLRVWMPGAPLFKGLHLPLTLMIIIKLVYCLRQLERKQTHKNNTKLGHENIYYRYVWKNNRVFLRAQ